MRGGLLLAGLLVAFILLGFFNFFFRRFVAFAHGGSNRIGCGWKPVRGCGRSLDDSRDRGRQRWPLVGGEGWQRLQKDVRDTLQEALA